MSLYKYIIGDKSFKTKQECYKYTSQLVNKLKDNEIYEGNEYFNYFYCLLQQHTEKEKKIGCGIKGFTIKKHSTYNHNQLFLIRKDNVLINFSFVHCCKFNFKYPEKDYLIKAMRSAIDEQIFEFKNKNKKECFLCKVNDINIKYHVDHYEPSFKILSENFILKHQTYPTKFSKNDLYRIEFNDEDHEYKIKQYKY